MHYTLARFLSCMVFEGGAQGAAASSLQLHVDCKHHHVLLVVHILSSSFA
jgi:hypothetical protein